MDALHDRYYGGPGIWPAPRDSAGAYVDENTALQVSTVFNCVLLLAQAIATLPLFVYERLDNGGKAKAPKHPLFKLLHSRFNNEVSSKAGREAMAAWYFLWGNAYAQIERAKGVSGPRGVKALWVLPADRMTVRRGRDVSYGRDPNPDDPALWYYCQLGEARPREFPADQILHIPGFGFDGIRGLSRIGFARRTLGLTVSTEEMGTAFFAKGMNLDSVLEHPGKFSQAAHDNIMKSIVEPNQGMKGAGGPMLLWEGMKLNKLTMPLKDAQFLELRQFQTAEICRFFNMPLHKVKNMAAATWGNVEQENIAYVVDTLRPELVGWEQAINLKLFGSDEDKYFCEFLVDGLLRGDKLTRTQSCQLEHNNGNLTNNEWREIENRNPVEGGDKRYIPAFLVDADAPMPVLEPEPEVDPTQAEQPPGKEGGDKDGSRSIEVRRVGVGPRLRLRNTFGLVIQEAAERVVKREVADARRVIEKVRSGNTGVWLEPYYEDEGEFAQYFKRSLAPGVHAYGEQVVDYAMREVGDNAKKIGADFEQRKEQYLAGYMRNLWREYKKSSMGQLASLSREALAIRAAKAPEPVDEWIDVITARVDEWSEKKAGKITDREKVAIGEAFAALVFTAAAMRTVWVPSPGACPICLDMAGRTVDPGGNFVEAGDTVGPDDAKIYGPKAHPPLHAGCVCSIGPA